jgi:hypothetical protein
MSPQQNNTRPSHCSSPRRCEYRTKHPAHYFLPLFLLLLPNFDFSFASSCRHTKPSITHSDC